MNENIYPQIFADFADFILSLPKGFLRVLRLSAVYF